ncbi:hypothetical protein GBAR_LOCUS22136 [Geodia barretti]|uniref:Uncharacterized protein n=1 Tax=Geodia barretti TaxID=519541 RepID=A0AA35T2E1_GEOBA|nr:hypothetical protein GBAR_LOCUS22136 [Geodia barretti]
MSTSFNNSGNYTCVARSSVFDDVMSRLALVLIQVPIGSPVGITSTSMTSTTLTDLEENVEYNISFRTCTSVVTVLWKEQMKMRLT